MDSEGTKPKVVHRAVGLKKWDGILEFPEWVQGNDIPGDNYNVTRRCRFCKGILYNTEAEKMIQFCSQCVALCTLTSTLRGYIGHGREVHRRCGMIEEVNIAMHANTDEARFGCAICQELKGRKPQGSVKP